MTRMLVMFALAATATSGFHHSALGQTVVRTRVVQSPSTHGSSAYAGQTYTCPKCGRQHAYSPGQTASQTQAVQTVRRPVVETASATAPVAPTSRLQSGGPVRNVLAALNAQRSRQGVGILRYDPQLQAVAQRRAQAMAARGLKSHPPGSFAPGRYEGVGWSGSYSPSGVRACYTSDPRMQYAGAAMATGRDGVYFAVVYR